MTGKESAVHPDSEDGKPDASTDRPLEPQPLNLQKLESLSLLAGGAAHDFNNFLTGILGNAGLVLRKLPADSPCRSLVQEIERAAGHAGELAAQLLAYAGHGQLEVQSVPLSRLVRQMAKLLEGSIPGNAHLMWRIDDAIPEFLGDPGQIRQVVLQLILNAVEALSALGGSSGGYISLATGTQDLDPHGLAGLLYDGGLAVGPSVFLEVSDSGCGMDETTRQRLLEPFFTTKGKGRGLGMATVFGIVRSHRGGIRLESAVGRGTTVRLLFPLGDAERIETVHSDVQSAAAPSPDPHPPAPSPGGGRGGVGDNAQVPPLTILVVDDEEYVLAVAQGILEDEGFLTLGASGGAQALEIFEQHGASIDGVLLDLTMPDMDGRETFCRLRELSPTVDVLVTSGRQEVSDLDLAPELKAPAFLPKPFRPAQLIEAFRQLLDA